MKEEVKDMKVEYKAQAVLGLSNFGGISIMLDPEDNDYLYYQWYDEEPVRAEIHYTEMGEDLVPVFSVGTDEVYRLDEFMRVGI